MGHDLSRLERQLETLDKRIAELTHIGLSKEMQLIIHRPGWTTPAEFLLVTNAVESLTHTIEGQIHQSRQLLEAARQVKPTGAATTAA